VTTYWFRAKRYGYGATPVTWQGWLVTGAAIVAVLAASLLLPLFARGTTWVWFALVAIDAISIAALWMIGRRKTQGEWRWRWSDH